ncbi:MAG: tRNA modification GTPase [bacterium]
MTGSLPGESDTICAVATPPGAGALAVIRVSGPQALRLLDRVVAGARPSRQPDRTVRLYRVRDEAGTELDEVIVAVFRAPRSYTGEDVAEVSCHGSEYITGELVRLCCRQGCRRAEAGEFSRRAVLNGRLSLSRAEAVVDLVNSRSAEAHRAAFSRYSGDLARRTGELLEGLEEARAATEYHVGLDETDAARPRGIAGKTRVLLRRVERLLTDAGRSRFLHEGARVVIVGRPNVGKSTLFNRLVGEERAVAAPFPGTTRDRVEATVSIGGVPVMLTDTGGISTRSSGSIARRVAEQTATAVAAADLMLAVFDGSELPRAADRRVLREPAFADGRAVCVVNKLDAGDRLGDGMFNGSPVVRVSSLTGENLGRLRALLRRRFSPGRVTADLNSRHRLVLEACRDALARSLAVPDSVSALAELEAAREALAEIDVPADRMDILDRVFARFCVGK